MYQLLVNVKVENPRNCALTTKTMSYFTKKKADTIADLLVKDSTKYLTISVTKLY